MTMHGETDMMKEKAAGALLGAAYGDALGWPNEFVGRALRSGGRKNPSPDLIAWTRRSGGRYSPFDERISRGSYSDDTQLLLCVARSRLAGQEWFRHWSEVELPFWSAYERGGGGATKRAASAWLDGHAPWIESDENSVRRYFQAGGNGVVMRILPHVLFDVSCGSFDGIADSVMLDGIATHGHPRALVPALCYGYALWQALTRTECLGYGDIVSELLAREAEWARLPDIRARHLDWIRCADNHADGSYARAWGQVVGEIHVLLERCRDEIEKGVLASDLDFLTRIGAIGSEIKGAGTVGAVAALYLVSRYAADPVRGVTTAAFAHGADTDTIASMVGGLLGATCGMVWLGPVQPQIQDNRYLARMAECLIDKAQKDAGVAVTGVRKTALTASIVGVFGCSSGTMIVLPDGRRGRVEQLGDDQYGRSGRYRVQQRRIVCDDGQTIQFHRISKGDFGHPRPDMMPPGDGELAASVVPRAVSGGVRVPAQSFAESVAFYEGLLGLHMKRKAAEYVVFDHGIVLVTPAYAESILGAGHWQAILHVEVPDIQACHKRVSAASVRGLTGISEWGRLHLPYFRCLDPDGNVVEVFAARTGTQAGDGT